MQKGKRMGALTFEGTDGNEVILKDQAGNEKRVFVSLLEKYGRE